MSKMYYISAGLVSIVIIVSMIIDFKRNPKMRHGEILPANEMKAKYNLSAENYEPPKLDPEKVPEHLRTLLTLAAKWGVGDDIIRYDFEQKATEEEKQELKIALTGKMNEITKWLDTFELNQPMSDEAACFMFMQLACDEMGIWQD